MNVKDQYNTVILGGGGVKCLSTLGALHYIYEKQLHQNIVKFIGTSAGSMICLLLIVGFTPIEIMIHLCTNNIFDTLLPMDVMRMIKGKGAFEFIKIEKYLRDMVKSKIGCDSITLNELFIKFGKQLIVCTYNLTNNECMYMSNITHPELDSVLAVGMSSAIPIVFEECIYNNEVYVDGGLVDNFPICIINELDKVIGVYIHSCHNVTSKFKVINLLRVVTTISSNMYIQRLINEYKSRANDIIEIRIGSVDVIDFSISPAVKLDLFSSGYQSSKTFYDCKINESDNILEASTVI